MSNVVPPKKKNIGPGQKRHNQQPRTRRDHLQEEEGSGEQSIPKRKHTNSVRGVGKPEAKKAKCTTAPSSARCSVAVSTASSTTSSLTSNTNTLLRSEPGSHLQVVTVKNRKLEEQKKRDGLIQTEYLQKCLFLRRVRTRMFGRVKFLTGDEDLDFSADMVQWFLTGTVVLGQKSLSAYWSTYRKEVNQTLNTKRGNVNNAMKQGFMSTYVHHFMCVGHLIPWQKY